MSIGGPLRYDVLAQANRPTDPAKLREEVRRLATSQGLTAVDISAALRIDLAQVREMIAASSEEAAQMCRRAWE